MSPSLCCSGRRASHWGAATSPGGNCIPARLDHDFLLRGLLTKEWFTAMIKHFLDHPEQKLARLQAGLGKSSSANMGPPKLSSPRRQVKCRCDGLRSGAVGVPTGSAQTNSTLSTTLWMRPRNGPRHASANILLWLSKRPRTTPFICLARLSHESLTSFHGTNNLQSPSTYEHNNEFTSDGNSHIINEQNDE